MTTDSFSFQHEFSPSRRGLALYGGLALALFAAAAVFGWLASLQIGRSRFVPYLILAAASFVPVPFLAYYYYALRGAKYTLDRDRLTVTWGWRIEQIPLSDVEWVRPLSALAGKIPLPTIRLPGLLLGSRRHRDLGLITFFASDERTLLLIAAGRRILAISPEEPAAFVEACRRLLEMGSLIPAQARSVYPVFVIAEAWQSLTARFAWLSGLLLNVGLAVWVGWIAPTLPRVALGFSADRTPADAVPGPYLILLPVVSATLFAAGWLAGLFFYRRPHHRTLAQAIWISGAASSLLFLAAVLFIVTTPI